MAELAKQVCAFANSSNGFIVYGMRDKGAGLDDGVPEVVPGGRQSSNSWVEQIIPTIVQPPLTAFQARHIPIPGHHAAGFGVLVVWVPLSALRPHWIEDRGKQVPYLRAGEHSHPMTLQTFRDVLSRGGAAEGKVVGLGADHDAQQQQNGQWLWRFNPIVQLLAGPATELWCLQVRVLTRSGNFVSDGTSGTSNYSVSDRGSVVTFHSHTPLFPRLAVRVATREATYIGHPAEVETMLSVGSAEPVTQKFRFEW
jgi:hypothetical protein